MDTAEFIQMYITENSVKIRRITKLYSGWPKPFYERLAERTAHVDYACRFDGDSCFRYKSDSPDRKAKCCCSSCAQKIGYYENVDYEDLCALARLYDKELGFWRPGTGCIIPRRKRSSTCLVYHCASSHRIKRKDLLLLMALDKGPYSILLPFDRSVDYYIREEANFLCRSICNITTAAEDIYTMSSKAVYDNMAEIIPRTFDSEHCISALKRGQGECPLSSEGVTQQEMIKALPFKGLRLVKSTGRSCTKEKCPMLDVFKARHKLLASYLRELLMFNTLSRRSFIGKTTGSTYKEWLSYLISFHHNWGTSKEFFYKEWPWK